MDITQLLIIWLLVTVSLIIVSKIPLLGVEIDSFGKALISGAVFGLLNAIGQWLLDATGFLNLLSLGLYGLILNTIVFGLAAKLVVGFRLRHGIWSALLGAFFMAIVMGIVDRVFGILNVSA
ncbi:MAG: phage holin family protein [Synechococcales cyanobacterium K44_A2020_017]|nr:phage holin family protein [Synechococcales cyanobacterium K32_A2020_035]MBF2093645.1 phage holin family protein [Synechococcales cyanobacterium K44_A2020_017]